MNDPIKFIKFWPRLNNYGLGYEIHVGGPTNDGRHITVNPVTITSAPDDDVVSSIDGPAFDRIPKETLQDLMDKLWSLGFRPQDIGTAGHLAATKAHLDDAKKIRDDMINVTTQLMTHIINRP